MSTIIAQPFDAVLRAGKTYRSVVVTFYDSGSGHSYARQYFHNGRCEDFVNCKLVVEFPTMLPERVLSDAWNWIGEQATRFMRTGTDSARAALMDVAKSL